MSAAESAKAHESVTMGLMVEAFNTEVQEEKQRLLRLAEKCAERTVKERGEHGHG